LASKYQTSPDNLDKVAGIFKDKALPLVSHQLGFKGVYLLTEATGDFMVLNIWDTEQQATTWPQHPERRTGAGLSNAGNDIRMQWFRV